ncbi:hypothetical protein FHS19_004347 [Paenibacillus rhizosphaerae]|uniref:YdhG-like domain-containing protein n=1 Tax=Paenibacillus rhizosphaerae TaxID=297318 RepID=A0A839TSG6_9BACL|nr:DUF1801 domain-containing protein [Paenibacillus rhizosphaerae]MBB3129672.1 hypothetical protein [Paenibacillus rhizosphaerae]
MPKPSSQHVEDFLTQLDHPLKLEIEEVRKIILNTDEGLSEHIKWNAPSFLFQNDDRLTFNLHGKGFFRLVLHCGAKSKDPVDLRPHFEHAKELLEWSAPDRATIRFTGMEDVESKREVLQAVIRRWLDVSG